MGKPCERLSSCAEKIPCQAIKKLLAKDTAPGCRGSLEQIFDELSRIKRTGSCTFPFKRSFLHARKISKYLSKNVLKRGIGFQSARWYDKSHTDLAERGLRVGLPKFRDMW